MALIDNLQAWFKFEDNSNDAVGSNNGTDTAISYSTGAGKINKGADFNGSTSKISIGNAAGINGNVFTYNAWINPTDRAGYYIILASGSVNAPHWYLSITDGKQNLSKSGVAVLGISNSAVPTGAKHMVTITYDGTNIKFYLDGAADGTPTDARSFDTVTRFIGNDGTLSFLGSMDELAIWNRVLTPTEIGYIYNNGIGETYPPFSPSISPSASRSPSASASPSASISPSISPSSSASASVSPSGSVSASISPSGSISPSSSTSPSASASASLSPSSSVSASISPSASVSASNSPSGSTSPSLSPSPSKGYSLYSRGNEAILPANNNDLENIYTELEESQVAVDDLTRVGQLAQLEYMIHEFKNFVGYKNTCNLQWVGRSTLSARLSAVYLEIYNHVYHEWDLVDSNHSAQADREFELKARINSLDNYKDGAGIISCRVHQLAI